MIVPHTPLCHLGTVLLNFQPGKMLSRLSSPSAESAQFPIPCRNPSPAPRASPSRRMPAAPRQCHSRKGMDFVSSSNRSADHRAAHPASKILLFYPMKIPPPADCPAPHHTKRSVSFTRRLLFQNAFQINLIPAVLPLPKKPAPRSCFCLFSSLCLFPSYASA